VGEIERYIRTIKERAHCSSHLIPFKKMPAIMIQGLVGGRIFWLNSFPPEGGISTTMSPRTIMTGKTIDYSKHCRIMFRAYAQVHEEHDNSMQARTVGAIALRPTGNEQGCVYFMSLATGHQLNRNHWTELPMPQDVINRVHNLDRQSYAARDLVFQFRDGGPMDDDDASAADPDYIHDEELDDKESIGSSMDDDEAHNQEENELENEDVVAADDVHLQVGNQKDNDDDHEKEISAIIHTVADDGADEDHHEADAITGVDTNEEDDNLAEADESAGVAAEETGGTNELDA
jgi:hypothetical protein